jgi:phage-related protein
MAGAPAILKIDIIADAAKAAAGLKKTGDAAQTTGSKLGAVARGVATGFAVTKVLEFGKATVTAAMDANRSHAKLTQVFKSMGDATGGAAQAAMDYAGALSQKIGVDDEAIMNGQTLLATFSNVNNEAARSAGIFNRATAAGADLAAAGFGSIESNAVLLGKALQDPIKGMAALRRVGVTLTDAQQKQVKVLAEHGKGLQAQKIILGAVEKQVGGTAAATATSTDKMNVAWGNTQEAIGNALLPVLEKLAPILETVAKFIEQNIGWIMPLAIVLGVLAVAWNIASVAATLFGVSMAAALWPVLLVIAAIAALIAIGILIVRNWDTIKAAAAAVWSFMVRAWNAILGAIRTAFNWIKANWPLLLAILTGPIGIAVALIVRNWDTIKSAIAAVFHFIRSIWSGLLGILIAPFTAAWGVISGVIERVRGAINSILSFASSVGHTIVEAIKAPINGIIRAWNALQIPGIHIDLPFGKSIGAGPWDLPNLPTLATGGLVTRTGLALVHEGETFSGVGGAGSVTNITVNVTTTGLGADAPQIQRAVVQALRGYANRNGSVDVPIRAAS